MPRDGVVAIGASTLVNVDHAETTESVSRRAMASDTVSHYFQRLWTSRYDTESHCVGWVGYVLWLKAFSLAGWQLRKPAGGP